MKTYHLGNNEPFDFDELLNIFEQREENSNGGNLHSVLEDQNLHGDAISYCLTRCLLDKDYLGAEIAKILLEYDEDSRYRILGIEKDN